MIAVKINSENIIIDTRIVDSLDGLDSHWVAAPSKLHGIGHNINDTITNPNQYREDRLSAYPSIGDQLDSLFHAGVFPDDMAAQIQAVKDKYPKPE
jgi:hypothetical protein